MKDTIVIHHSLTKDGTVKDWDAIRRYHKETKGWKDIGYQYGIEYVNGILKVFPGRAEKAESAACKEQKMNERGIHICVVGNFDITKPTEEIYIKTADLCKEIMQRHPIKQIQPHTLYATYKSCPGKLFDMDHLRELVFGKPLKAELIRSLSVTLDRLKLDKSITDQIGYLKKLFNEWEWQK